MSEHIIQVNTQQDHHDCMMVFSFYDDRESTSFHIDDAQQYSVYTTIKEVALFNKALELYQSSGFKTAYLKYINTEDPEHTYPEFVEYYKMSQALAKELTSLCHDEYSLVQLDEYCLETPPTYEDAFFLNKKIDYIHLHQQNIYFTSHKEFQFKMQEVQRDKPELFFASTK